MNNLDGSDLAQLISIFLTLILGVLPSYFDVKKNGRYTKAAFYLVFFFVISLFLAIGTTISNSIEEKEKYSQLFQKTNATLTNVNSNLATSNKTLSNSTDALEKLETLVSNYKALNDSLGAQIRNQQELNRTTMGISYNTKNMMDKDIRADENRLSDYDRSLINTGEELEKLHNYAEYRIIAIIDTATKLEKIREVSYNLAKLLNSEKLNPILISNPVIHRYWLVLEARISNLNFTTSAYGISSVENARSELARLLRNFVVNVLGYSKGNNSFRVNKDLPKEFLEYIEIATKNL